VANKVIKISDRSTKITPSSSSSLHQRILSEIEEKILSGEWPPGYRIPFEHELTEHYQCSRMTVNKVLTQLASAGLIERRRKAGSFVTQPRLQSAVLEISEIKAEVAALGLSYHHEVIERHQRRPKASDRELLGPNVKGPILDLVCHHFGGSRPFCLEERLINSAAVPEVLEEKFKTIAPGSWLVSQVPWSSAEHRIRASQANQRTAKILNIPVNTACLIIERRTFSEGKPITFVRLTYPGNRHELVAHFEPAQS
jgi:GntR family transcriptional regulator, histidine utilization repressor